MGMRRTQNLTHAGREVLATCTFNKADTAASLLQAVCDGLASIDPQEAAQQGNTTLADAAMDFVDMAEATAFSGSTNAIAAAVESAAVLAEATQAGPLTPSARGGRNYASAVLAVLGDATSGRTAS